MPTFEYKLLVAYSEEKFSFSRTANELGNEGWEFKGVDAYGHNVFMRDTPSVTVVPIQIKAGPAKKARKRTKRTK
jgi:hypothetical protein